MAIIDGPTIGDEMAGFSDTEVFNRREVFVEGWYWVLRSEHLKRKPKPIEILGRKLVLYRGESGMVYAMDAFCPHMGAHLAEGRIEGDSIRCLFHYWKFSVSVFHSGCASTCYSHCEGAIWSCLDLGGTKP